MNLPFKLLRPLAFFDLETTGTNVATDRIVQIFVMKFMPDGTIQKRKALVDPEMPIPKAASDVHGITNEYIAEVRATGKKVYTFRELAQPIREFVRGCDLGGYNSNQFDIPMFAEELFRCGILDFPEEDVKMVDPCVIFRHFEERTLTGALKFFCGKVIENAHDAEADTVAAAEVLIAQIGRYPELKDMTVDQLHDFCDDKRIDLAGKMKSDEEGKAIFTFGKHKDKRVYNVFKTIDPSYYKWLMKSDFTHDSKVHFERFYNLVHPKK